MSKTHAGQTVRQGMIILLEAEECTLRDISQALHIT